MYTAPHTGFSRLAAIYNLLFFLKNIGEHNLPAQSITLEFPKAFSEVITLYDLGGGTIYAGSVWVLKVNPKPA